MPENNAQIVIDDEKEVHEEDKGFEVEGLSAEEVALAKDQKLIIEDDKDDKVENQKEEKQDDKEEEVVQEHPTFDQVEKDEKLIDKYNRNEKSLYWRWKTDKHKRQEAQTEAEALKKKLQEMDGSEESKVKLQKIKELLKNPDSLTIESLESVLGEKIEVPKKEEKDDTEAVNKKVMMKAQFAEKIGNAKYDNFEAISTLAKEVIESDSSKTYQKLIDSSFLDDNVDENMLVERVVNIARMNPKFNETVNQVKSEDKEKINRVLSNSKKKISSAAVSGASGKRIISESELTVDQATRLSAEQWGKLKPETRDRILRGINP